MFNFRRIFFHVSVDVGNLNRALFSHGEQSLAKQIQTNFAKLLEEIFAQEAKIWLDSSVPEEDAGEDHKFGPEATIEDIVKNNSQPKPVLPPYHLLGNIFFDHLPYPCVFPLPSLLVEVFTQVRVTASSRVWGL